MRVCAIVLDYRGAEKTETCLRSLVGQQIDTTIVVDNSPEPSASMALATVMERVNGDVDYELQIIGGGNNLGFARGVNLAICSDLKSGSPHDVYLLLNNDAIAPPNLMQNLMGEIEGRDAADLVAPMVVSGSGESQGVIWYNRYLGAQTSRKMPGSFAFLSGCCLLFRRTSLDKGRLFDESFFMYGEDVHLGWRLQREGKNIRCLHKIAVQHGVSPSSSRGGYFYEYHMVRAHVLLALKTWRWPAEIPFMVAAKICWLIARALVRSFRYRSFIPALALFSGLLPLPVRKP